MRDDVKCAAMGDERATIPGSMVLLTRLAKQVYRRSDEDLLGMHLRHLMTLSYLRDHVGCPQQELAEGNFTWEQLKLMRIKFLSEYGM